MLPETTPPSDALALTVVRFRLLARRLRLGRWALVVALAALTAVTVERLGAEAEITLARYGSTREVVVAVADVPAGTVLDAGSVRLETRPVGLIPADAVVELPLGAVTAAGLVAGEVVVAGRLAPAGASPLAAGLPAGTRGVAVPRTDAVPELAAGDRVDVLVAPADDPVAPAGRVAASAPVVGVGELAVVVAVPDAVAGVVAAAAGSGLVSLVLVPATG